MTTNENTNETVRIECPKCNGGGRLHWTRNANGVCFTCEGTGRVDVPRIEGDRSAWLPIDVALNRAAEDWIDFAQVRDAAKIATKIATAIESGALSRAYARESLKAARARDLSGPFGPKGRHALRAVVDAVCAARRARLEG